MPSRYRHNGQGSFIARHPVWFTGVGIVLASVIFASCVLLIGLAVRQINEQGGIRLDGLVHIQYINDTPETLILTACATRCTDGEPFYKLKPGRKLLNPVLEPKAVFWTMLTREDGTIFGCLRFEYPLGKVYEVKLSSAVACPEFPATPSPIATPVSGPATHHGVSNAILLANAPDNTNESGRPL